MKHFIAMAGLKGCMPAICETYAEYEDAVDDLCQIHDIPPRSKFRAELRREGYVDLQLQFHGNEYAEIQECDCLNPWEHSENVSSALLRRLNNTHSLYERGLISRESYLQTLEEMAREFFNG